MKRTCFSKKFDIGLVGYRPKIPAPGRLRWEDFVLFLGQSEKKKTEKRFLSPKSFDHRDPMCFYYLGEIKQSSPHPVSKICKTFYLKTMN